MATSATLTIRGLDAFRAELKRLPAELTTGGAAVVLAAAEGAAAQMDAGYAAHEWTGNLRRGLTVTIDRPGPHTVSAVVHNRAPHAYWAEVGTQIRRTAAGANRGAMPPIHVFFPAAQQHRRRMEPALIRVVERAGLTVTG